VPRRQRAIAGDGQLLDAGIDFAAELRALVRRQVLEEDVQPGRDGAVVEALGALQFQHLPKAVLGHRDGDQLGQSGGPSSGASTIARRCARSGHLFEISVGVG